MRYSDIGLVVLAAKTCGLLKTNAKFWLYYSSKEEFMHVIGENESVKNQMVKLKAVLDNIDYADGMICAYDSEFPRLNRYVTKRSEKPCLLIYRGDITLLKNLDNNVAVIGHTNPSEDIIKRERNFVNRLIDDEQVIVSGLAKGCDTIAHQQALKAGSPTIAILPSTLNSIYPAENKELAEEVAQEGGLLLTEYFEEPNSRYDAIGRFIERDRLQALFSKAVVLTASYRKDEGDSGSRHAISFANDYKINTYVLLSKRDVDNAEFGLNVDLVNAQVSEVLTPKVIEKIIQDKIEFEDELPNIEKPSQLALNL